MNKYFVKICYGAGLLSVIFHLWFPINTLFQKIIESLFVLCIAIQMCFFYKFTNKKIKDLFKKGDKG